MVLNRSSTLGSRAKRVIPLDLIDVQSLSCEAAGFVIVLNRSPTRGSRAKRVIPLDLIDVQSLNCKAAGFEMVLNRYPTRRSRAKRFFEFAPKQFRKKLGKCTQTKKIPYNVEHVLSLVPVGVNKFKQLTQFGAYLAK
jgi:hypothetical protein